MKLTTISTILIACTGCGSMLPSTDQNLSIEMFGVLEEPEEVPDDGNANPKFYEFIFKQVTLQSSAGDVVLEPASEEVFKIIDRPQIVFTEDISDYDGETFSGLLLEFDPEIIVGGKYDETAVDLENPIITSDTNFTIEKAKGISLKIRIQWQNTLIRDTAAESEAITQASFDVEIESD
jgi:hypothetical protein